MEDLDKLVKNGIFLVIYYCVKCTTKVHLYHKVTMSIYLCPRTYAVHGQIKFPKHVLQ